RRSPTSTRRRVPRCSTSTRRRSTSGARLPATPPGRTTHRRRRCRRSCSSSPRLSRAPDLRRGLSMAHGLDAVEGGQAATPRANAVDRVVAPVNDIVGKLSSVALVAAGFVLTYSVIVRYFLKISTDWQDEMSVFLIVGAVFMSSAAVQAIRGHVAIEAIV